ncbi:MAG TPA: hypothetical protein VIH04_03295 [Nitrosarchaeum sp.]
MNSTVLALCSLEQEVAHIAKNSYDQGREHLNDLEIEHLIKMTEHVVMKIKKQVMENVQ